MAGAAGRFARCLRVAAFCLALGWQGAGADDGSERSGDILRLALPAAAFALAVKRDDRAGRRDFYESFGATVAGTWGLKELVGKERPDGSDDNAFPSGHAAVAFHSAGFLHRRYGIRVAWPAYAAAAYTGWTRVDADEHDAADVLAGAALGIASAFIFTDRWPELELVYGGTPFAVGVAFTRRF